MEPVSPQRHDQHAGKARVFDMGDGFQWSSVGDRPAVGPLTPGPLALGPLAIRQRG
jgi:hypothetical protein